MIRRTMPTGSRSRTTSAHAGRTQRHRSFPRHALRRVGRFVWRTAGHAVLRSKVGRDRMRSASEKLARSNATVPLPALKTLLAGRAGIRPIRAAPRFSPTISLIQRSSQKKMIERRKKTVEMYCNFLRLIFVARNRNRVVPTKRFSGRVSSCSEVLQGDDNDSGHHDGTSK